MFPMTVTVHNRAQLHAVMTALTSADTAGNAYAEQKAKTTEPKAEGPKAAAAAPTAKAKEQSAPAATTVESPSEVTTDAPAAATYEQAAKAITALSRAKGRNAAVAVLKEFSASNLKEVKPEQFADVITAAEKAAK